eukprot:354579-Chlamydomonas_euryale.AAC.5
MSVECGCVWSADACGVWMRMDCGVQLGRGEESTCPSLHPPHSPHPPHLRIQQHVVVAGKSARLGAIPRFLPLPLSPAAARDKCVDDPGRTEVWDGAPAEHKELDGRGESGVSAVRTRHTCGHAPRPQFCAVQPHAHCRRRGQQVWEHAVWARQAHSRTHVHCHRVVNL